MNNLSRFILVASIPLFLSGCIAAAAGAGVAGGMYLEKNYKVSVSKKKKDQKATSSKKNSQKSSE